VVDYIDQSPQLKDFFAYPPTLSGLQKALDARKKIKTDRAALVQELKKQYKAAHSHKLVEKNIEALLSADTFTITTAHQSNIFTGPLYFIYKILHTIKLAEFCNNSFASYHFVPVFYMGTEDADLEELNHIHLGGEKLVWNTGQTGAVGRMKIDRELIKLVGMMEGQLAVQPFGKEIISLIRDCYQEGETIQSATFRLVHALFADYGLVVLLPDSPDLKRQMIKVFKDDLLGQTASGIVEQTATELNKAGYKTQVNPREINLFYLKDNIRDRITRKNIQYSIFPRSFGAQYSFNESEIVKELEDHPGRFSPNVILRGLYQETILPNIAFVGGGGETSYWLQLKGMFDHYKIPFPVLVLRNSFLVAEKKMQEKISKLGFAVEDFFLPEQDLMNRLVARESKNEVKLNGSFSALEQLYESFKKQATAVDASLARHVDALRVRTVERLQELEKKMLRAEKRKFADQQRQVQTIRNYLFPGNGLQERYENISYYYAKWGKEFIHQLSRHSLNLEQEFVILQEK
jgi:bacillithiol biosynthesis cysteine-adding enzyme BshC